ncbi:MAG: bifunctional riboflavin kinase/FAD synthetase [Ignavibacteriae bacterium]|nr:MAG: bifunctional riboflavin kinase/FAD synthetase [Ignavibacteriota bacterium]
MKVYRNIDEIQRSDSTIISIGTFDGVHRAHKEIIKRVLELAHGKKSRSLIITFDPHPQEVLKNKTPEIKLLTSTDEKLKLFEQAGIDCVWLVKFTEEFSKTDPRDFYEKLIYKKIGISDLVIGYDHVFGRNREGDFNTLKELGEEYKFNIYRVEAIEIDGITVSSTKIRHFLMEGDIESANKLLGYNYSFEGIVMEGDRVARQLGFPTANLQPVKENKVIPGDGVYVSQIEYNGNMYDGMMYLGFRPTLTEGLKRVIEVNMFDFDSVIYGGKLNVSFIKRLRGEKKFDSKEELIKQISSDKKETLEHLRIIKTENK